MNVSVSTPGPSDAVTVSVAGEVDLSSSGAVERAIVEAVTGGQAARVVVDLTGVTFMDSSGISALLKGRRFADAHHVKFQVTGAQGTARQVLELTGVWEHLSGKPARGGP